MLVNESVHDYISLVDSLEPAPGGGSVAALVGSSGVALAGMYSKFSTGKKAFAQLDETTQKEFIRASEELTKHQNRLEELVDEDAKAYPMVVAAYRLPKETEDQKAIRSDAIQSATIQAMNVPLEMMRQAVAALELLPLLIPYGNKNVVSDAYCAAILLHACNEAASLNVNANIPSLQDEALKETTIQEVQQLLAKADKLKETALAL